MSSTDRTTALDVAAAAHRGAQEAYRAALQDGDACEIIVAREALVLAAVALAQVRQEATP